MNELIQAVKDYAEAHYETGGWDFVVETYTDEEIAEAIEGCTSIEEALQRMAEIVDVFDERRADAEFHGKEF